MRPLVRIHSSMPARARERQRGAIAVAFILLAALLLAFMGLATDIGRLYVSKSELQNAADSCALAAAAALTGANPNQLQIAEDFGITTGTRNLMAMQGTPVSISPNSEITFSDQLDGTYRTRSAISAGEARNMRYARCTLAEQVSTIILQVANAIPGQSIPPLTTVNSTAVATTAPSNTNCPLPVAVCKKGDAPTYGLTPGEWLQGIFNAGNQQIEGAFKWVEYPGYETNSQLAQIITSNVCEISNASTVESHQGYIDAMLTAWNTRLGIYKPGGPTVAEAQPDATGWIYDPIQWPAQNNAYPDYANRRGQASPKHQTGIPGNQDEVPGSFPLPNPNNWAADADFQSGNDRRMVAGPVVDCDALGGNGTTQILDWACYLMLNPVFNPNKDTMRLEFTGLASNPASGCVSAGMPGGPTAGGPKVPTLVQ